VLGTIYRELGEPMKDDVSKKEKERRLLEEKEKEEEVKEEK
jgi:hypothetical protein